MKIKQLAEAIFLFSRIENLLREHGGKGESFSDLVKSFNTRLHQEERLKANKQYADSIGYKFYRSGNYYLVKDQYDDEEGIEDECDRYEEIKEEWSEYLAYKRGLIGGFYNNLRTIGHARNQLMHQANYTIKNFPRFKRACYQVIDYLEKGKKPLFAINLHDNETLKKRITFIALDEPIFWFKYLLSLPIVYLLFQVNGICTSCSAYAFYGAVAGTALFFFHLLYMFGGILRFSFKSEGNIKGVLFLGFVGYMVIGYLGGEKNTESSKEEHAVSKLSALGTQQPCQYYYVQANRLNIRSDASLHASKVGTLKQNQKVCIIDKKQEWAYIDGKGWVASRYLAKTKKRVVREHKKSNKTDTKSRHSSPKPRKAVEIWHCEAKAKRASGWVEKVGKSSAIAGALHQCEIRRVTETPCAITQCYRIR